MTSTSTVFVYTPPLITSAVNEALLGVKLYVCPWPM
jgi:hypothetical protein